MLLEIGQEWKNLTKGKVRMKIYAGGIVGDERDMVRKMRIGQIHAAAMTSEGLSEIVPQFAGFFIPLVFQTHEDIDKVKDALLPDLKDKMDEQGFKLFNLNDFGWVYWFSKNTIKVPSDLKKQSFLHGLVILDGLSYGMRLVTILSHWLLQIYYQACRLDL